MNVSGIGATVASYSIADSGDAVAVLQALQAGFSQEMQGSLFTLSDVAAKKLDDLSKFAKLDLTRRLNKLAPAGGTNPNMVLGSDLASAKDLVADLSAGGYSLRADEVYSASFTLYDKNGKVIDDSGANTKTILTADDMAMVESGTLIAGPDANGVEQRQIPFLSGSYIVAKCYTNERTLTASKADVDALISETSSRQATLGQDVTVELTRLGLTMDQLLAALKGDDSWHDRARKEETSQTDTRRGEQTQTQDATRDQQTLELRRELLRVDAQKQKAMNPERENG